MGKLGGARLALVLVLAVLTQACDESAPTTPSSPGGGSGPAAPAEAVLLECVAVVSAGRLECEAPLPGELGADPLIIGGQGLNVILSAAETSYDPESGLFGSTVTIQNLTSQVMGTPDGTTVEGVRVFFEREPEVSEGTGAVAVRNADGTGAFTGSDQPYFSYPGLIDPLALSAAKRWEFDVPNTVKTFTFSVYLDAPVSEGPEALHGAVWTGVASADWNDPANWAGGVVPQPGGDVMIPPLSHLQPGAHLPDLSTAESVDDLYIGAGSDLDLGGATVEVSGSIEATGPITGGTIVVKGTSSRIGGSLPSTEVTGSARVQRETEISGSLTVSGVLEVTGGSLIVGRQ